MSHQRFPLQICIKDIWHDHILFDGQRVGGIVDFGAMNIDTVASDLARLLGSLVGDSTVVPTTFNADSGIDGGTGGDGESTDSWQLGLAAYHCVRPLSDGERRAVQVWDRANVLLSGLQWLSWVFIDGREFENRPAIVSRCRDNLARLIALSGASPTS